MKKIIVPIGYMGSGSSALTDLLREYPTINTKNADFEYIFLHAPNGVFDLENKLLNNNNAIRSDEAIKSFRKLMEKLYVYRGWWVAGYNNAVSENFLNIIEDYISSIKTSSFTGTWYIYERPSTLTWLTNAILNRLKIRRRSKTPSINLELSLITEDKFYSESKNFIENIINEISKEDTVVLDQLLLPHNLNLIEKYKLETLYPIIISRDPRDVFISNKYFWAPKGTPVPYPLDVHEFCKYYKSIRTIEKKSSLNVLQIDFEDLVLNYETTISKIEDFIKVDSTSHIDKLKFFNPNVSINNLQIYKRDISYEREIKIIERELAEYLYNFPSDLKINDGKVF